MAVGNRRVASAVDATTLVVPLWPAISVAGGLFTFLIGVVVWVLTTFERRHDAIARAAEVETRVANLESNIHQIGENVSYIRGWLEKGGMP